MNEEGEVTLVEVPVGSTVEEEIEKEEREREAAVAAALIEEEKAEDGGAAVGESVSEKKVVKGPSTTIDMNTNTAASPTPSPTPTPAPTATESEGVSGVVLPEEEEEEEEKEVVVIAADDESNPTSSPAVPFVQPEEEVVEKRFPRDTMVPLILLFASPFSSSSSVSQCLSSTSSLHNLYMSFLLTRLPMPTQSLLLRLPLPLTFRRSLSHETSLCTQRRVSLRSSLTRVACFQSSTSALLISTCTISAPFLYLSLFSFVFREMSSLLLSSLSLLSVCLICAVYL